MIVFGGTFDPIHNGHIHCANAIAAIFKDEPVHLMLAKDPNLKNTPVASTEHRWQMLQLGCESNPQLVPDDFEMRREGKSTTVRTAQELRGSKIAPIIWVIGSDAAASVEHWREQSLLSEHLSFLVVKRPNFLSDPVIKNFRQVAEPAELKTESGLYFVLEQKMLSLSSTEIRSQAFAGLYINGLVPYSVYRYIRTHSLYLDDQAAISD